MDNIQAETKQISRHPLIQIFFVLDWTLRDSICCTVMISSDNRFQEQFQELVLERHLRFEHIGHVPNYNQVAVQISEIGSPE